MVLPVLRRQCRSRGAASGGDGGYGADRGESGRRRLLKIGITLQLTEDAAELSDPAGSKALDLVISQFSQAERVDVTGARDALKAALEQKVIEAYEGDVMGIYYSEYVTQ